MSKCGKPVTVESIWASERLYSCAVHAMQLQQIGEVMGTSTNPKFIISDKLCENEVTDKEDKDGDMEIST